MTLFAMEIELPALVFFLQTSFQLKVSHCTTKQMGDNFDPSTSKELVIGSCRYQMKVHTCICCQDAPCLGSIQCIIHKYSQSEGFTEARVVEKNFGAKLLPLDVT